MLLIKTDCSKYQTYALCRELISESLFPIIKVTKEKGGRLDEQGCFTNKPGSIYRTWYQNRSSSQDALQEQLAAEAKMSRSHLSSIEALNSVRPFSLEVLFNIADALEVEPSELLISSFPARKEK